MLTFVHLLVGAAIGKYLNNPWLVIPIAFLSHFLLDAIPHAKWKVSKNKSRLSFPELVKEPKILLLSIEPVIAIILTIYLLFLNSQYAFPMFLGAFFCWLPDFFVFLHWKYDNLGKLDFLVHYTKWHKHISFIAGIIPQIIIAGLAFAYLLS